jgi:hypothetical protein
MADSEEDPWYLMPSWKGESGMYTMFKVVILGALVALVSGCVDCSDSGAGASLDANAEVMLNTWTSDEVWTRSGFRSVMVEVQSVVPGSQGEGGVNEIVLKELGSGKVFTFLVGAAGKEEAKTVLFGEKELWILVVPEESNIEQVVVAAVPVTIRAGGGEVKVDPVEELIIKAAESMNTWGQGDR